MNEPRTYQQSPALLIFIMIVFAIIFGSLFFAIGTESFLIEIIFGGAILIIFGIAVLSLTGKTIISEEEITTKNLFGEKTLRWTEINRAFGSGIRIKLQNSDGDVTVSPSPQVPGYEEIVEWIGRKRPDLFSPQEYGEMRRGFVNLIGVAVLGLLFLGALLGFAVEGVNSSDTSALISAIFVLGIIVFAFFWMIFASPQSVTIDGRSLVLKYVFNQKTLPADEIASVNFSYTRTRNGKQYFIALYLKDRKTIRISGLGVSLPIAYLVLKNWHTNNAQIQNQYR